MEHVENPDDQLMHAIHGRLPNALEYQSDENLHENIDKIKNKSIFRLFI